MPLALRRFPAALLVLLALPSAQAQRGGLCLTGEPPSAWRSSDGLPSTGSTPPRPDPAAATIAFEDSVHALVVFVRFENDTEGAAEWPVVGRVGAERIPAWGDGLIKEAADEVDDSMGIGDPSLSAYFYWQSKNGPAGPHVLTGEVWPRDGAGTPVVYNPDEPSAAYKSGRGTGYGYMVQDVLDALVRDPAFDVTRFDANRDGEFDHLMLVVRRDPDVALTGGVANLSGVNNRAVRTSGRPAPTLTYERDGVAITVDMGSFGSGTINWVGGEYAFRTLVHEYGHVLFDMGHTRMITPEGAAVASAVSNDVPFDVPERGGGAYACQYNRMCGGGATGGVPYQSSNYDATVTLSGSELRRMGWARRTVLDPARDTAGVRLRPLFASGDVVLIPLRPGSGADTLSLENRQRTNAFDRFPPWDLADPFYGLVYRDLATEGLLATLTYGSPTGPARDYYYDFAPPSNALVRAGTRCDGTSEGCADPYAPWEGDMLEPGVSAVEMTPWTRPNVSGYTVYPEGFEPNWFAITGVRYALGGLGAMAFDLVADVRQSPEIVIRADSWMGAETSGTRFAQPVRVTDGSTLRVWQGATVTFAGGLAVDDGAAFVCEEGSTCPVGGE